MLSGLKDSLQRIRLETFLCRVLGIAVILGLAGCSPEQYKAQADKEVYQIIDSKWQDDFGHKSNYIIKDSNVPPSPDDIQIELAVPASGVLSLAQAVAIGTAHNREYQRRKEQLYLVALDLTLARHQFARQWFGTVDAEYVRDSEDEKVTSDAGLGFQRLLADGAVISIDIAMDWTRFLTGDPRTSLASILSASASQPLLRGRGRRVVQENLTQAERDVLYQIRSFNRYRKEFVVSIASSYYRVLQLKAGVSNAENSYYRLVESRKRLEIEAEAGLAQSFDVDEAEQRALSARNQWVQTQQSYERFLDEFKVTLSLPPDAEIELDGNELKALEEIVTIEPGYALDEAVETAFLRRLDLASSRDRIDDAARKVELAADGLGMDLNLLGSAGVGSTPETDFERLQFHEGTYRFGLEGDLPLDRKAERNAYREALIALEQQQRQYEIDRDRMELDVRQALRSLKAESEQYQIQKMALELAERRLEHQKLLLDLGQGNVRLLLESEGALLDAQNDVMSALVTHAIAKLGFFRDIGILQVRPDGMWEQQVQ
ncbi:MAG: TolC family protein [Planctomycetota bacterium]|jgi:outer membrane protein TolC